MKARKPQVQEELCGIPQEPAPPWREELGAAGLAVQAGAGWARGSGQVLLIPRNVSDRPAHGNAVCRSSRSLDKSSSCTVVFPRSRGVASRSDTKR